MNPNSASCKWGCKESEYAGLGGKVSNPDMQNKLLRQRSVCRWQQKTNITIRIEHHTLCLTSAWYNNVKQAV